MIVGPESHVRDVASATTEAVDIDGKDQRVREVVNIGVTDSQVRLVDMPQTTTVVIDIWPAPIERDLMGVPVRSRNLAPVWCRGSCRKWSASACAASVMRCAPASRHIDAFVDLAGLGPGRYSLRVQVDPSEEVGVGAVTPSVVTVTIK